MPRRRFRKTSFLLAIGAVLGLCGQSTGTAVAQGAGAVEDSPDWPQQLYLEVHVNGHNSGRIVAFRRTADGHFAATADALQEAGLQPPRNGYDAGGFVALSTLPGIGFEYDETRQIIAFTADEATLIPHRVAVRARDGDDPESLQSSWGAFSNYSLVAVIGSDNLNRINFEGVNGALDAHFSTPLGVLDSSALMRFDADGSFEARRLETTWTTYDPARMLTFHAGDSVSGGLAWTRPIRFGGLQIQRDFSTRPDLITRPLPSFSGSAAVPTTIEVYTNNVRTYFGEVDPGPFVIENLPVGTGASTTTVVLRDFLGRETAVELPYYGSQRLLAEGMIDYSVEAGFPRLSLGTESFDYRAWPFGSASLRYGVSDRFTAEAHLEASEEHVNGGIGGSFMVGSWGAAALAVAGSQSEDGTGGLASAGIEIDLAGITAFARTQRTFGNYADIASVSAGTVTINDTIVDFSPPAALDQAGLSFELPFDPTRLALNYSRRKETHSDALQIANLSLGRSLPGGASLHLTASALFNDSTDYAVFASVSFPIGDDHRANAGVSADDDGPSAFAELARPAQRQPGNVGWLVGTQQGKETSIYGDAVYHGEVVRLSGTFDLEQDRFHALAELDGAVVIAGGSAFLSNQIYDAYAVVDAGAPEVEVFHENRPVGRTGAHGRIVIPNLRSFQENHISIDPSGLPIDAHVPNVHALAIAQPGSGVLVNFDVETETAAALVSFLDESGRPIDVGSGGVLEGQGLGFVVGYDGEAYLQGLSAWNRVTITRRDRSVCVAEFAYDNAATPLVRIEAVPCRRK